MAYLIIIPIEFLIGMIVGIYSGDHKKGLSFNDLKVGAFIFFGINIFILLNASAITTASWLHLCLSFVSLFSGAFVGEYIVISWRKKIVSTSVKKADMQVTVNEFIQKSRSIADGNINQTTLMHYKLNEIMFHLRRLNRYVRDTQQLHAIGDSCRTLARVSVLIGEGRTDMKDKFDELSIRLSQISWETLVATELTLGSELSKSSFKILRHGLSLKHINK
jgi:uncharacterized protein YneF (UPF0154 family)